ncbi:hypothetical protein GGX14DRAFT_676062 [Mycena pura]|uniref:F-box domain-containing protein n=1 Tax=Mycena pura TaxID=153505 RepID=A0AAD6VRV0_9AGAR|nr:hypothetical protein GGX14DRAFT_676062 [Mycena pura]
MGQRWWVINLDKRERHDLRKLFFGGFGAYFNALLRNPKFPDCLPQYRPGDFLRKYDSLPFLDLPPSYCYFAKTAPRSLDTIALVNLPVELIYEILSYLDEFFDLLFFSMTCQALWEIGRDYLPTDIPEGLLSTEEREKFLVDEDGEYAVRDEPFNQGHYLKVFSWDKLLTGVRQRCLGLHSDIEVVSELCKYDPPPSTLHVLRNLSRQQYVRESALLALRDKYKGTKVKMDEVTLGQVVHCRICLSSSAETNLRYQGDIEVHRGVWAGDRFDIISAEWVETPDVANSWTDVSKEALEEMEEIWVAEYAPS